MTNLDLQRQLGRVRAKLNDLAIDLQVGLFERKDELEIKVIKREIDALRLIRDDLQEKLGN